VLHVGLHYALSLTLSQREREKKRYELRTH
jgi:hypothetical protein